MRSEGVQDEFGANAESILPRGFRPVFGAVLGSGLGDVVNSVDQLGSVDFSGIKGLPVSGVPGHAGCLSFVRIAGVDALLAAGRVHLYEGRSAAEVTSMVRLMSVLGVETILLTNAAGSLCEDFHPGQWMVISDHINLLGASPLEGGPNFFDMSNVYDKELRLKFRDAGASSGVVVHEGVYASVRGPQYETPAEVRMLKGFGADAVGMSTVLEAIQARALGVRLAGLSRLTNWAAGMGEGEISHEEVIEGQKQAGLELGRIMNEVLGV